VAIEEGFIICEFCGMPIIKRQYQRHTNSYCKENPNITIKKKRNNDLDNELLDFTNIHLEDHCFVDSRTLASKYSDTPRQLRPPMSLVCRFGQILKVFREEGLIVKYNNRQYRVIK